SLLSFSWQFDRLPFALSRLAGVLDKQDVPAAPQVGAELPADVDQAVVHSSARAMLDDADADLAERRDRLNARRLDFEFADLHHAAVAAGRRQPDRRQRADDTVAGASQPFEPDSASLRDGTCFVRGNKFVTAPLAEAD